MTYQEWLDKATRLYGENAGDWKFKCPVCKTIQTAKDFVGAGASKEQATQAIANECIGRFKRGSQKAFGDKKVSIGEPCDYAGYGLIGLNPVEVVFEDGSKHYAFDFADEEMDATKDN